MIISLLHSSSSISFPLFFLFFFLPQCPFVCVSLIARAAAATTASYLALCTTTMYTSITPSTAAVLQHGKKREREWKPTIATGILCVWRRKKVFSSFFLSFFHSFFLLHSNHEVIWLANQRYHHISFFHSFFLVSPSIAC